MRQYTLRREICVEKPKISVDLFQICVERTRPGEGRARSPGPAEESGRGYCAGQMMAPVLPVVQPPVSEKTRMLFDVVLLRPRLSVTVSRAA